MKKHNLGTMIKDVREYSGLSQKQLATKIGWGTAQFVSNIERGVSFPTPKAAKIISALGASNGRLPNDGKSFKELIVKEIGDYHIRKARKSFGL